MASDENLYKTLRAGEIDSAELSEMALWHFHSANDISPTEVVFGVGADNSVFALKFVYKKEKHRVAEILRGPGLTQEDPAAFKVIVDRELETPETLRVAGQTLFSDIPVAGWFRYRDLFQIVPMPAGAPRGSGLFGANPFIVQFRYRPSKSLSMLSGYRIAAEGRKIQLLLNALLEVGISSLNTSRHHWVVTRMNPITTEYRQEMYEFPGAGKFRGSDSFATTDGIELLAGIEPQEYYTSQLL